MAQPQPCPGIWKVIEVKNTMLELGVAEPVIKDFRAVRKKYLGKSFTFSDKKLFFPATLKNMSGFSDSVLLGNAFTIPRKADTDQSLRYPGDELNCDSVTITAGMCYVGDTFMKMLGATSKELYVINAESDSPDKYTYKVCCWRGKRMGLLLDDSNVLLILLRISPLRA